MKKKAAARKTKIRKTVRALTAAVMIPVFCLAVLLYRSSYRHYYDTVISANEAILETAALAVEDNEKLVENLIELMSYDKTVTKLLKSRVGSYNQVVSQIFDLQDLIGEGKILLSHLGGEIVLFADNPALPSSYWYLLPEKTAEEMAGYRSILASGLLADWTGEEFMYPESTVISKTDKKEMLSYYRIVTDSLSGRLGVIKCGVLKDRFLEAATSAEVDGSLFVTQDGEVIYGEDTDADRSIYISHPIGSLHMNFQIALDRNRLIRDAAFYALPQLLLIFGMELILFFAGSRFTRSVYRRIDQLVDAAVSAKNNYMDVMLPHSDDADINALTDAMNALIRQIRSHAYARIEHERKEKNALRLAFQYQMNPHFLFNTLNWIQMCTELGCETEKTSEGIVLLGRLLRYNLNGEAFATVACETEHTRDYICLMNMRKNDAISLDIRVTDIDPQQKMMRFLLQPLCENAIQHGLIPGKKLHITIQMKREDNRFVVSVKNDGTLIPPDQTERILSGVRQNKGDGGVGLSNLYARMKLLYGETSELLLESGSGETCITLKMKVINEFQFIREE